MPPDLFSPVPVSIGTGFVRPEDFSLLAPETASLSQLMNPCGPIAVPGSGQPGASNPPLWIVPPGNNYITNQTTNQSTQTTGAAVSEKRDDPLGVSLDELHKIQFPWWIVAILILLFLLTDRGR
jgi:hypothetical protein